MTAPLSAVAGIDLGGTATRIVIVRREGGEVLGSRTLQTNSFPADDFRESLDQLVTHVKRIAGPSTAVEAVGVGASGPIDNDAGVIKNHDTLSGFSNFPIAKEMSGRLNVPVYLENDSMCAALGEYSRGAGVGSRRMLMVTLGTGVGVAVVDGGVPFRGVDGNHPEAGHIGIGPSVERCYCGSVGCWEQIASRRALEQLTADLIPQSVEPHDRLSWLSEHAPHDQGVSSALAEFARAIGRGLLVLSTAYSPDRIVLGGSVAKLFDVISNDVKVSMVLAGEFNTDVAIVEGSLGNLAGALGAAAIAQGGLAAQF